MKPATFLLLCFTLCCTACQQHNDSSTNPLARTISQQQGSAFKDYWYQGKAEISTYELEQNRYQDIHPGQTTLIFVTEDFLTDEQVKNDTYTNPNSTSVLKTNLIQRFTTGLYDYSIMTSVFTPVDTEQFPNTLKTSTSSQDWCGQSWMQVNKKDRQYALQQRSYFEKEGDLNVKTPVEVLEDELLNRIRIQPTDLPQGEIKLIPSNQYLRLAHRPFEAVDARAALSDYTGDIFDGQGLKQYTVTIPALQRELSYVFSGEFPHQIEGWTDQYPSAFDQKIRTTIARRQQTIMEPYWQQNRREDQDKRKALGLTNW